MKHLFFTAILAIVAIGGALTTKAGGIYYDANSVQIDCTGTGSLCRTELPSQTLWTQPDKQGITLQSNALDNTNRFQ